MLLVYTGRGKGKTCACVGQALRAIGRGMAVAFGQFMKRDGQAGEQAVLTRLLGGNFRAAGPGFLRGAADRPAHEAAAAELLAWARERLTADMLVLDEAVYALNAGALRRDALERLLDEAARERCHVVLSGRDAPDWLVERADLVTSMTEVRHPWRRGVPATPGIEM